MGAIVGAAVVSHVPPIVMSEADRREMNGGDDISLVPGLHRLRAECLDRVRPDTVVVVDTHWFSTFEHIITAHDRRAGRYTSEELPRAMAAMPYDFPGDPELADAVAARAGQRDDTWVHATRDEHIAVHYPTINLLPYLQRDERWVSVSICQTATAEDFMLFGELIAQAVACLDRRVVILASGGMSHRFWPLRKLRAHEGAGTEHITDQASVLADLAVIEAWERGDHRSVLEGVPAYRSHKPEGMFGHYLVTAGAIGGAACTAKGVRYSNYEAAAGTGQVHVWFDRPDGGWTA